MGYTAYNKIFVKGKPLGRIFASEKAKTRKGAENMAKKNNSIWNKKQKGKGIKVVFVKVKKTK